MNKIFSGLVILPILFSCSQVTTVIPNKVENSSVKIDKEVSNDTIVAEVSKEKGASFMTSINLNSFSTKDNVSGTPAKQPTDVAKVDVYLLKLAAGFTGTDPLGTTNANVVMAFPNLVKTGAAFNILFKNVPGLANPNQYYVGVVAKDSANNVIGKTNATWTGQTMTSTPALALSTLGVGVDTTTLAVSSTTDLVVNIPLLDAVGAQINSNATVTGGNTTIPNITAQ